jgi:hypothetical protein
LHYAGTTLEELDFFLSETPGADTLKSRTVNLEGNPPTFSKLQSEYILHEDNSKQCSQDETKRTI